MNGLQFFPFFTSALLASTLLLSMATGLQAQAETTMPPAPAVTHPKPILDRLPLFFWQKRTFTNFGDQLALFIVQRMVENSVEFVHEGLIGKEPYCKIYGYKKLLALGSILYFARNDDVIWGTGYNNKIQDLSKFNFDRLDVRSVRGPLTRKFLQDNFAIDCPEIYGDPALLIPHLFPEFQKPANPSSEYVLIVHYDDIAKFPKSLYPNAIYATEPWHQVIRKILDSRLVISSSMHGLIIAEAYGIPARYLRVNENEPLFKFYDYYLGSGREGFQFSNTLEEALEMGGEPPMQCDLKKLYESFPFEYWPNTESLRTYTPR